MDQKALVNDLIVDGEKLLKQLAAEGISVTAAAWVKEVEANQWFLYMATPLVDEEGIKMAYHRVNTVWRQMPDELALELWGVKLVGPREPMAVAMRNFQRRNPRRNGNFYEEGGKLIGGVEVEAVYLYPVAGTSA